MPIYQQNTLTEVSDAMFLQLPRLLQHFDVDYYESSHAFHLACPIHGGDNPQGCLFLKNPMVVLVVGNASQIVVKMNISEVSLDLSGGYYHQIWIAMKILPCIKQWNSV